MNNTLFKKLQTIKIVAADENGLIWGIPYLMRPNQNPCDILQKHRAECMKLPSVMQACVKTSILSQKVSKMKSQTLQDIQSSTNILASFNKYGGDLHKISITYYTKEHAITLEAWAKVSFNKRQKANHWCDIVSVFKPYDFEAEQIDKERGTSCRYSGDESVLIETFKALCAEIDTRNRVRAERFGQLPKLHLDAYQSFNIG